MKLKLDAARTLHVVNLHLKSRLPSAVQGQKDGFSWKSAGGWAEGYFLSSMKRVGQALETRLLVDKVFDEDAQALLAVVGDFNADLDEVPVLAIRGRMEDTDNASLAGRVLFPAETTIPEPHRFSHRHHGQGNMLDHVLVSRGLLAHYKGSEIHNETLPDESLPFRSDKKYPEPDHAAVAATFELP